MNEWIEKKEDNTTDNDRPIKAQQMRHKKTGEIVTSVPLTQINNYELVE